MEEVHGLGGDVRSIGGYHSEVWVDDVIVVDGVDGRDALTCRKDMRPLVRLCRNVNMSTYHLVNNARSHLQRARVTSLPMTYDDVISRVCSYFNSIGVIQYFGSDSDLCGVVVLEPSWIYQCIQTLVTQPNEVRYT